MKIFFKLKNIENLEYDDQIRLIKKYISKLCKFQNDEINNIRFIRHIQQKSMKNIKDFAVGCYIINDGVEDAQIDIRLKSPVLYEHFDVFVLL